MVKAKLPTNYTEILAGRESQMLNLDSSKPVGASTDRTEKRRHCTFQEYRGAAGNDTRNKHIVLGFWQGNRTALNCDQGLNYFQKIMQQRPCTSAWFKGSATPTRIKHSYCLHWVTSPQKSSHHYTNFTPTLALKKKMFQGRSLCFQRVSQALGTTCVQFNKSE